VHFPRIHKQTNQKTHQPTETLETPFQGHGLLLFLQFQYYLHGWFVDYTTENITMEMKHANNLIQKDRKLTIT